MSTRIKFLLLGIVLILGGCAHPITITPDLSTVGITQQTKSSKSIGYYLAEPVEKEVTTSGGGGDNVKYKPYKDLETGLYKMYAGIFSNVTLLSSSSDPARSKLDYIAAVEISTSSSSPSLFTWPPTVFTLNLANDISDAKGTLLGNLRTSGEGRAEFSEFKNDFGLAGKRASQEALNKMQGLLTSTPFLGKGLDETTKTGSAVNSKEDQLKELQRLYSSGLITEAVFSERQRAILNQ
jgi:hypothetical protein